MAFKLLVESDMPTWEDREAGTKFGGKLGHWLKINILRNAGIEEGAAKFEYTYPQESGRLRKRKKADKSEGPKAAVGIWNSVSSDVPLLCISDASAKLRLGVESVASWHGHIDVRDGRVTGCTYPPTSVIANPNLLPLVIRETSNLLEAGRDPSILRRPTVVRGVSPYHRGQEAVVDLEWEFVKGQKRTKTKAYRADVHGDVTVVGISYEAGKSYSTYDAGQGLGTVREHLSDGTRIIGHNFIAADLPRIGSSPKTFGPDHLIDTMIVAHLIHPHFAGTGSDDEKDGQRNLGLYGLEDLVRFYQPTTAWKQDKDDLLFYNGLDTAYNFRLWKDLEIDLSLTDQWHLVEKDQRLAEMARLMRVRGMRIDSAGLRRFSSEWEETRNDIKAALPFNPGSWQQIKKHFAKLKLTKTDLEYLRKVQMKLVAKGKSDAELDSLIAYKDEGKGYKAWFSDEAVELGRIHPKFNVTGTAVARFSSSGPNAQNIKPEFRRFILPQNDDEFLASFDGKNIEGRTVAWNANDTVMLADFASGLDIHRLVSSRIFNKRFEDVSDDERQGGKRTVHASNYMELPQSLAGRIYGVVNDNSISKAIKLQEGYFGAYKRTREWQLELKQQMSRGDITLRNPQGRVRSIYERDDHERAKRACHFMGCSTGADVVNQRALDVWDACGQIPQSIVHDELLYSLPLGEEGEKLVKEIQEILDSPIKEMNGFVIPFGYKAGSNYSFKEPK